MTIESQTYPLQALNIIMQKTIQKERNTLHNNQSKIKEEHPENSGFSHKKRLLNQVAFFLL